MRTLRLLVDLTYADRYMHGDSPAAIQWFEEEILGSGDLTLFENENMGDTVGTIKIIDRNPPRWIPCSERMPEESVEVLVWNGFIWTAFHMDGLFYQDDGNDPLPVEDVTHWMPLPEPPEATNE